MTISRSVLGWASQFTMFFASRAHAPAPISTISHLKEEDRESENLIILLPGISDTLAIFEKFKFIDKVRKQNIDADLLLVDAHVGYYAQQTVLDRLKEDVVAPARSRGYKNIWLAGASLGGMGAALYSAEHESDLTGSLLIAPYLGDRALIQKIEKAGGPYKALSEIQMQPHMKQLWNWLQLYFKDPSRRPKLVLGYGDRDKFAYAHSYLSEVLPANQVMRLEGKHDWESWGKIWSIFLERFPEYS